MPENLLDDATDTLSKSFFQPRKRLKTLSLCLITVLVYTTIGVCLANIDINLLWWLLIILIYHLCLSLSKDDQISSTIVIVAFYLAIVALLERSKPDLSLNYALAIGFFAAIDLPMVIYLTSEAWGRSKAISFSTSIAWLGLTLGWLVS
jgi:hypothetical protein